MRIAVMGAGGVGGYFGARLVQAGNDVAFIARGRHLEALRAHGLSLKSPAGDATLRVRAIADPAEAGQADVILFTVKLWDTESAAEQLRPIISRDTVVIPLQNGVESVARIGSLLGAERVMGGAAYIFARIAEPGVIVHTGTLARLRFGAALPSQQGAAEAFERACGAAGVEAERVTDIERVLWEKFVLLVGVSGLTALTRQPIGVVRSDPDTRALLEAAMHETWQVGRARGVALADDFVAQQLAVVDGLAPQMKASMLGDLESGGRLEAPWLQGAVVRMARAAGFEAPANRAIYAALKPYLAGRPAAQT
jgi:2-dehydropantoate 2-reductase